MPFKLLKWNFSFLIFAFLLLAESEAYSQNAKSGSWLSGDSDFYTSEADAFLNSLQGKMRLLVCQYLGSELIQTYPANHGTLNLGQAQWQSSQTTGKIPGKNDEIDLTCSFRLISGKMKSAGIAVAFDFSDWTTDNYILVPAQIYGGNRFRILPIGYAPYIYEEKDRPLDMPVTTTNILHLNPDGSHVKIEMNTGNLATPMLSFFNPKSRQGFILLAEQQSRFGNNGLFIEEDAGPDKSNKKISFVVSAPGIRGQRYVMCGREASGDVAADWNAGDNVTLRFKIFNFEAENLVVFYQKVFEVRKAVTGKNTFSNITPYSAAAGLILEHHNAHKWFENDKTAHYSNQPGGDNPYYFQVGWGGLPIFAYPNVIAETPERLRRMTLTLDNLVFNAQGKTGLFYAINQDGKLLSDVHGRHTERPAISMTRRSTDMLYFCLKMFDLMKKRGHADMVKPEWENKLRFCADGLVQVYNDYRQFGQFIDVETGKMDINGSTAACGSGAALALASVYFNESKYLELAESSTRMYYERDFLKGYAGGGAAEILQSPDSEAPWDMVESCMILYEVTGKSEWVERAKFAANMLATWMVSYDYKFPVGSAMQKAGTHAAGSIFASSQNNHSAPGYYILSGDCMLKLYRATGDKRYAEMYKDQSHNVIQYVGAPYNPLRKESGFVTERVQLSDWEGHNEGSVSYEDSNMAWETLAALTALENPGIYLQTDAEIFLVMDHVEATVVKRDNSGVTIKITNPTLYDAKVSIFAETAKQSKQVLKSNSFDNWVKVGVNAGKTVSCRIEMNGKLKIK